MGIGLRQSQVGLYLRIVQLVGPQLQQRADFVGRIRSDCDLQTRRDLVVGLRDLFLDEIDIGQELGVLRIEIGNHGPLQLLVGRMLMVSSVSWSRTVISLELAS